MDKLTTMILEITSFYEALTLEKIILSFESHTLLENCELTLENLQQELKKLTDKGYLKEVKTTDGICWKRIFPRKREKL